MIRFVSLILGALWRMHPSWRARHSDKPSDRRHVLQCLDAPPGPKSDVVSVVILAQVVSTI